MNRLAAILLVGLCLSVAGCGSSGGPTTTDASPPLTADDCGPFGAGGVFLVAETNATVGSRAAASDVLAEAQANGTLAEGPTLAAVEDPSTVNYTAVDRSAVRHRQAIRARIGDDYGPNATLYYRDSRRMPDPLGSG